MTYESRLREHKTLYYTFIDFKKAYDSVHRGKLIEVLIRYKVHPKIIDIIVQMYEKDETTIHLGRMKEMIEVTCGIRQGCSISTLLFKMVTFSIIEELLEQGELYSIREYEGNSLWLADDATIIANSKENASKALKALEKAGGKCGLELSTQKTKIVQIRGNKTVEEIGDYKIEEEVKYLGIQIGGRGRDIFQAENRNWIQRAEKKANEIISQIKKSFDKVIIGKAIWKMMSLPGILFGRAVVVTSKTAIEKLQRIENKVWRYLLGIGGYSTVEALRGEIGASMVKTRIMETILVFIVDTLASDFRDIKKLMNDSIEKGKGKWFNAVDEYRQELELTWEKMREIDRKTLKGIIK